MASIFTKIINNEIPSYKVYEDNKFIAILDVNPNTKGHTLCIPKKEVDKLFDLPKNEYLEFFEFSRKIAKALEKTISCNRVGVAVVGLEVPHAHIHLIPINQIQDMTFQTKTKLTPEEFQEVVANVRKNIE